VRYHADRPGSGSTCRGGPRSNAVDRADDVGAGAGVPGVGGRSCWPPRRPRAHQRLRWPGRRTGRSAVLQLQESGGGRALAYAPESIRPCTRSVGPRQRVSWPSQAGSALRTRGHRLDRRPSEVVISPTTPHDQTGGHADLRPIRSRSGSAMLITSALGRPCRGGGRGGQTPNASARARAGRPRFGRALRHACRESRPALDSACASAATSRPSTSE